MILDGKESAVHLQSIVPIQLGHSPNTNDIKILHQEKRWFYRSFLEMTYIPEEQRVMNKKSDLEIFKYNLL